MAVYVDGSGVPHIQPPAMLRCIIVSVSVAFVAWAVGLFALFFAYLNTLGKAHDVLWIVFYSWLMALPGTLIVGWLVFLCVVRHDTELV